MKMVKEKPAEISENLNGKKTGLKKRTSSTRSKHNNNCRTREKNYIDEFAFYYRPIDDCPEKLITKIENEPSPSANNCSGDEPPLSTKPGTRGKK